MRKLLVWMFLVALAPLAAAHDPEDHYGGHGYFQYGVGGCSIGIGHHDWFGSGCGTVSNIVGGGEGFIYRGLAIGGEGGWGWINDHFEDGLAVVSVNPSYHFKGYRKTKTLVPFVTGGYSGLFRSGHLNGFNVGGGATWWGGSHAGLRFEGRVHHFDAGPVGANVYLFRIGLALR